MTWNQGQPGTWRVQLRNLKDICCFWTTICNMLSAEWYSMRFTHNGHLRNHVHRCTYQATEIYDIFRDTYTTKLPWNALDTFYIIGCLKYSILYPTMSGRQAAWIPWNQNMRHLVRFHKTCVLDTIGVCCFNCLRVAAKNITLPGLD